MYEARLMCESLLCHSLQIANCKLQIMLGTEIINEMITMYVISWIKKRSKCFILCFDFCLMLLDVACSPVTLTENDDDDDDIDFCIAITDGKKNNSVTTQFMLRM